MHEFINAFLKAQAPDGLYSKGLRFNQLVQAPEQLPA